MIYLIENSVDHKFPSDNSSFISTISLSDSDQILWKHFSTADELVRVETEDHSVRKRAIIVNESQKSQFDTLIELARSDRPPDDTVACLALMGSDFHGNRGRPWEAMRGNLHFSSFSHLNLNAAKCGPALSMLPTLAVTDVIASFSGAETIEPAWIKWVNDVYLGERKVSGSLVSTQVDGERVVSCVLGIGLNLEVAPQLGGEVRFGAATSLKEHGIFATIPDTFERLLDSVEIRLNQLSSPEGPEMLFADYRDRLGGVGRSVEICEQQGNDVLAAGKWLDVHSDLSLEIEGTGRVDQGRLRFVDSV